MTDDAWSPSEIAERARALGVAKARAPLLAVFVLSVLAGAFISLGALFYLVVVTGPALGFGVTRLLGGLAFSLGLVLVAVTGAELFTGNNLVAMAWASRLIGLRELLRNWAIVYAGNVIGALGTVALVWFAGIDALDSGGVANTALAIGRGKIALGIVPALVRGVLGNALVCLAVWLSLGGRSVTDKVVGIVFPIAAFVAAGFEHSIANWFFLPYAFLLGVEGSDYLWGAIENLVVVSIGNLIGGTLLVAGVYWLAYLGPWTRKRTE